MTRLLMTCDAVGGVWQYATDLAAALRPHGIDTTLAVLGPSPDAAQRASVREGVQVIDTGLPLDWLAADEALVLAAGEAVASLARSTGAHLVHLNTPALGAKAVFDVPVLVAAHGCVATWWRAARSEPLDPSFAWHAALTRRGLAAADVVVAPTEAFARTVAETYALPTVPIAVHNGRRPAAAIGAAVAPHAFTAGRLWDPVKGAVLLDRVADGLGIAIRCAGPLVGPHGEAVDTPHLATLGSLDSHGIAAELAGRPVYVSTATFEPFGLAVLEAAQAGCPLVLSDIAPFRELWDGVATFVAVGDADGFAAAIGALVANPALADRLGRAAAARAARFVPEATAAAMAALYAGLTGGAAARAAA